MSSQQKGDYKAQAQIDSKPTAPAQMYVLDTTCRPGDNAKRTHDMPINGQVRPITFEYGKPLALPEVLARKFLEYDAFLHTNAEGDVLPYQRRPKQPEDLGAGEALVLKDDETIARFDELSTIALQNRVIAKNGGEKFAASSDRGAMIAFLAALKPKPPQVAKAKPVDGWPDLVDLEEEAA